MQHEHNCLEFLQGNMNLTHRTRPGSTTGQRKPRTLKMKGQTMECSICSHNHTRKRKSLRNDSAATKNLSEAGAILKRKGEKQEIKWAGECKRFNKSLWIIWPQLAICTCPLAQKLVLPKKDITWWTVIGCFVTKNELTAVFQEVCQLVKIQTCPLYPNKS